jgi:hypothetical protein
VWEKESGPQGPRGLRAGAVGMSVLRGVERRVFAAYPRRIAATKAKVLYVPLELWVRIEALVRRVIGSAHMRVIANISSMMSPDVVVSRSGARLQASVAC